MVSNKFRTQKHLQTFESKSKWKSTINYIKQRETESTQKIDGYAD